jgi:hypothetical protein
MLRRLGKLLFPKLPSDERKKRINNIILVLLASAVIGLFVVLLAKNNQF